MERLTATTETNGTLMTIEAWQKQMIEALKKGDTRTAKLYKQNINKLLKTYYGI